MSQITIVPSPLERRRHRKDLDALTGDLFEEGFTVIERRRGYEEGSVMAAVVAIAVYLNQDVNSELLSNIVVAIKRRLSRKRDMNLEGSLWAVIYDHNGRELTSFPLGR